MKVFLYEFLCAGGDASPALRREGWAMLAAVVADFLAWNEPDGLEVVTLLDRACPARFDHRCVQAEPCREPEQFRRLAAEADFTLVIAPECTGILAKRSQWVLEAGGSLLGSTPDAIALTADKHALAEHFRHHHVPTPAVTRTFPCVLKPRDGAGSQATFLVPTSADLPAAIEHARKELPTVEFLTQPYVPGLAASVAFLLGPRQTIALAPTQQRLSDDGRFHYLGGKVPLPPNLGERATALGRHAVEAVAGLRGYVGVDLVLAEDPRDDVVIEINPRLTTSYLGLRRLAGCNLTKVLWDIVHGVPVAPIPWQPGIVEFLADGTVVTSSRSG